MLLTSGYKTMEFITKRQRYNNAEDSQETEATTRYLKRFADCMINTNKMETFQGNLIKAFADVLGNCSVYTREIAERKYDDTASLHVFLDLSNEEVSQYLGALLEPPSANMRPLHASLAWLSTCFAAMAVKCLRTFSPEVISKFLSADSTVWKVLVRDGLKTKTVTFLVPKEEMEHLENKALNYMGDSQEWIRQLCKPMQCYLQTDDGEWSMNRYTKGLEKNSRPVRQGIEKMTRDEVNKLISSMVELFNSFVGMELYSKETEKQYLHKRLRSLTCCLDQDPEFWYFKNKIAKPHRHKSKQSRSVPKGIFRKRKILSPK